MNINRRRFEGNLTAEPEVNYSPKGTAVVSASIANKDSYGSAGSDIGRTSYTSCEFTGKHYGYHDRSPVGELAVMVQGCRQLQSAGRA